VARATVANILKAHGLDPAPRPKPIGKWLTATDFFTVEVRTLQGLVTHYVRFFIELTGNQRGESLHNFPVVTSRYGGTVVVRAFELQRDITGTIAFEAFVGDECG
jgi:hypothetical protein